MFFSQEEGRSSEVCSAKEALLRLAREYPFAARGRLLSAGDGAVYFWVYRDCSDCAAGDSALTAADEKQMRPPQGAGGRVLPIGKFEIPMAQTQTGSL
jgi:hypothetical protein